VLRHSFASLAADLGYNEPTMASLLRHKTHSITSRYVNSADAVLLAAADAVPHATMNLMASDQAQPQFAGSTTRWISRVGRIHRTNYRCFRPAWTGRYPTSATASVISHVGRIHVFSDRQNRVDCVRRESDILLNVQSVVLTDNADCREIAIPWKRPKALPLVPWCSGG
jgi:hypothetical protein